MINIDKKEILILSVTIFITVFSWVIFELVNLKTHSDISKKYESILNIKTEINYQIIETLKKEKIDGIR